MFDRRSLRGGGVPGSRWAVAAWLACAALLVSFRAGATLAEGRRWVGVAPSCVASPPWLATPLFDAPWLPAPLPSYCLYTWPTAATSPAPLPPSSSDIAALAASSGATELVEDVAVVFPMSASGAALAADLRADLRAHVGDASLLGAALPPAPLVRVVVVDSAPDALAGNIAPGTSRHGDTLAHLIEDIVCDNSLCAAEVTTSLALPWTDRGVRPANGGYMGTLGDLSQAIFRALRTWQMDRAADPEHTPRALVLNLSVGWEHTEQIADCTLAAGYETAAPARAVMDVLQHAASLGALVVAAAGNDTAGPNPGTGLLCPGLYQGVPQDGDATRPLLVAVSGVDYADAPLETARPFSRTSIVGPGLGGVSWGPSDPVPHAMTGSSVSAAVVSAVSAVTWAGVPTQDAQDVLDAVHQGGVPVGSSQAAPVSFGQGGPSTRASVCGALVEAGLAPGCAVAPPHPLGQPQLPNSTLGALAIDMASSSPASVSGVVLQPGSVARHLAPTVQSAPWVFPQPVVPTCPMCVVSDPTVTPSQPPVFYIPTNLGVASAALVVSDGQTRRSFSLGNLLSGGSYRFWLWGASGTIVSAYLTGFDSDGYSITEQILIAR